MIRYLALPILFVLAVASVARAQISPEWRPSDVIRKPGHPSPADLFRHHCPPRFKWDLRYRRCIPMRRGPGGWR
jgi:hypothetical protein